MTLPVILSILSTLFFGMLAILYAWREERNNRLLSELQKKQLINQTADTQSREKSEMAENAKITALMESITDPVFIVDFQNQLVAINTPAKNVLHINHEHPTLMDVLSSLPNTYNFGGKIQTAITHNTPIEETELVSDDTTFQVIITPVVDTNSTSSYKVIGASVLLHAKTQEKSVERMKEDFTNIIVHELRSPLTSIKASTQLLLDGNDMFQADERLRLIKIIHEQSQKLLTEVSSILDAAKLEAGLFTIEKVPADIRKVIEAKLEAFRQLAENKHITLSAQFPSHLSPISFDLRYIGQVITQLLSNSVKFTTDDGSIIVSVKQNPDELTIAVSDTGIGIAKDKQAKLFSKFSQIAKPSANVGTGIGLYLVKGIVEAHGGNINVISEETRGTTVSFTLPMEETDKLLSNTSQIKEMISHTSMQIPN